MEAILFYISTHFFLLLLLGLVFFLGLALLFELGKSHYLIYALLAWLPFENLLLRLVPLEYYATFKYIPEVVLYGAVLFSWYYYIKRTKKLFPKTKLNRWLVAYIAVALVSLILNWYSPAIWFFGLRQILRFFLIFVFIMFEEYPIAVVKNFLKIGGAMLLIEAGLGLVQFAAGGFLDNYLFFSDTVNLSGSIRLEGLEQFWAPGQRVFATLGRYDRLGSFLAIGLATATPWLYEVKKEKQRVWLWVGFAAGLAALVLTYSRASWIAFFAGLITVGWLRRDYRLFKFLGVGVLVATFFISGVLITNQLGGGAVRDKSSQSLPERVLEAFSFYSWQQSYEGYGRIFFIVNTPLVVVRSAPLFGVGPGNYGGGVAAALDNKTVYDRLHLPFGIQNIFGQIDNNWLSIWGEVGTLGLIVWVAIFFTIFSNALQLEYATRDPFKKLLAQGAAGVVIVVVILGLFGPYFEFRTLMMYFWLLVGIVNLKAV